MSLDIYLQSQFDWDTETSGVTIVKYKGKDSNAVVPEEIDGKPVTSIGDSAFSECSALTSITLPDGLKSIGEKTFCDCIRLRNIKLPDSVTKIGSRAFSGCSSLTSVTIPDGVTYIGEEAFKDCSSLTSITLPDGMEKIGDRPFEGCRSLRSITLPIGLMSFRKDAFNDCNLEEVWFTKSRDPLENMLLYSAFTFDENDFEDPLDGIKGFYGNATIHLPPDLWDDGD